MRREHLFFFASKLNPSLQHYVTADRLFNDPGSLEFKKLFLLGKLLLLTARV